MIKKIVLKINSYINPSWDSPRKFSKLNLLTNFSTFKPHGNQDYDLIAPLLIKNINGIIPAIAKIANFEKEVPKVSIEEFYDLNKHKNSDEIKKKLKENFNKYGSDKVVNQYHLIYAILIKSLEDNLKVLEIGLGTNNLNIVSNMGIDGKPVASLRAFKESLINSNMYGADVDKKILLSEERLETFFVDQTEISTFNNIQTSKDNKFDVIIDDGLHYQLSNLNSLIFSLNHLNDSGYFIIEDIGSWTIETWEIAYKLLPKNFTREIIKMTETNYVFLIKKLKV